MDSDFSDRLKKIEDILSQALPQQYSAEWREASFAEIGECVSDIHLKSLVTPCRNLLLLGGKRWRPLLLVLCAEMTADFLNKKTGADKANLVENAYRVTPLVEFVHTASLIHDDIEDSADMRRGKPAAHITFGLDTAINAGSWLYFEAPVCIEALDVSMEIKNKLYRLYAQELRRLHLGQAMDILWHRTPSLIPTEQEYREMVRCKTGTLASLAAQAGIIAAGGNEETASKAGKIAAQIGVGFQILDDVQNLTTGNPGKIRGDDIVENKKSLPVLMHLKKFPEDRKKIAELMTLAAKDGITSPAVEECIAILEKGGQIRAAFEEGVKLVKQKSAELACLYLQDSENADENSAISRLFSRMVPDLKKA
ncbi:MAG: polyprenyl synthetase family protein [Treponema sp.]|nr:polyprenyl synthetase family protein [Treponema sp.]